MKKTLKKLLSLLLIFSMLYSFGIIVFADSVQELSETAEEAVTYVSVEAYHTEFYNGNILRLIERGKER